MLLCYVQCSCECRHTFSFRANSPSDDDAWSTQLCSYSFCKASCGTNVREMGPATCGTPPVSHGCDGAMGAQGLYLGRSHRRSAQPPGRSVHGEDHEIVGAGVRHDHPVARRVCAARRARQRDQCDGKTWASHAGRNSAGRARRSARAPPAASRHPPRPQTPRCSPPPRAAGSSRTRTSRPARHGCPRWCSPATRRPPA